MEFSHEYFDDEVREDFYVSGLMKRLWAANLEVISDVAKVCDKYNIRWLQTMEHCLVLFVMVDVFRGMMILISAC